MSSALAWVSTLAEDSNLQAIGTGISCDGSSKGCRCMVVCDLPPWAPHKRSRAASCADLLGLLSGEHGMPRRGSIPLQEDARKAERGGRAGALPHVHKQMRQHAAAILLVPSRLAIGCASCLSVWTGPNILCAAGFRQLSSDQVSADQIRSEEI